jgi:hypothetical protein
MQGFIKTLFGDRHVLAVAAAAVLIAIAVLHSPATMLAGLIFPFCLLAGVAYMARR